MSRQPTIRGPQSALTSYLASQNISASRITADFRARRAAEAEEAARNAASTPDPDADEDEAQEEQKESTRAAQARKRKQQAAAIDKIKKSKAFKKRKINNDDEDDDDLANSIFQESAMGPVPGQMANCELCKKRFTVTAYSVAGPEGGLLCPKCGKKSAEEKTSKKTKKKAAAGSTSRGRRKMQSQLLDGMIGVKPLVTLCVETLANNIQLADDLGDLPDPVVDRISRQLAKRRLLDSNTMKLFLQPDVEHVHLYDAARLGSHDYVQILQVCSSLKSLKLRNAIQFKDEVMEFLIGRHLALDKLYLHGANLLSEACWKKYLAAKGKALKSLRVYFTDRHFNNNIVGFLEKSCPSLTQLKICHNQEVTDEGVECIGKLRKLERLGLQLVKKTSTMPYVKVIKSIGPQLRTFSTRNVPDVDDRLLDAIHEHCTKLTKLRITHSEVMTDAGFVRLFKDWKNTPLTFIDLELCRHVDAKKPHENEHMVGLCSDGFRAMMDHSIKGLVKLNVHGCRNISRQAFEDVFAVGKVYPKLKDVEISFCEEVTDFIVGLIFKACPRLKRLNVFGCMKVKEVRVPKGRILVGVPNAMGMIMEGTED
ncbi:RNI-like protein [Hypomontagnella monticulosa]|nr:RNI-like protein [Hypomontagnella monticulosa]